MSGGDVLGPAAAYLEAIETRLRKGTYADSRGRRVEALRPEELAAIITFLAQWAVHREDRTAEIVLELDAEARKHVVVFFGILPLIEAALQSGDGILYLACDGNAEAGANLDYSALMILQPPVHFGTWEQVVPRFENGYQDVSLSNLWVIGDLDWSQDPMGDPIAAQRRAGLLRVRLSKACHKVLIHQQGKAPLVPLPLKKAGCFIATAACGALDAWEVEALRAFRDRTLLPTRLGRWAVAAYERVSPPLARWLDASPRARAWVRRALIQPLARRTMRS